MESIYRRIADVIMEASIQVNLKSIMDYDIAKDNLFIRVSSAERNKDILVNVPHQLKEDLAITYHVDVIMNRSFSTIPSIIAPKENTSGAIICGELFIASS